MKKAFLIQLLFTIILPSVAQDNSKVLIAYFTWAENTVIIDRDKAIKNANGHVFNMEGDSGVDTITTASVLPPGNTGKMASWIKERTNGTLFPIIVKNKYSCYWDEILNQASREKARKERPELINKVENIDYYNIIFLGFPTWWYTIPMAVATFVEENSLENKTIIPFVSHGTSGKAGTIRDLTKILPKSAKLETEIGLYRSEINKSKDKVDKWLKELNY